MLRTTRRYAQDDNSSAPPAPARLLHLGHRGDEEITIHPRDEVDADLLGARLLALAEQRAPPEALEIHLRHHLERPAVALGLSLRQQPEMRDLRAREQGGGTVRARRHACSAADARGGVHRRG